MNPSQFLSGKESAFNARHVGLIPGSGRFLGVGNGNPFHNSCLENPMGRGAWWSTVHGVTRVRHELVIQHQQAIPKTELSSESST